MSESLELRPKVAAFAQDMERLLRLNDHKGGWKDCDPRWLLERLQQEVDELKEMGPHIVACWARSDERPGDALHVSNSLHRVLGEVADVANFAMMIARVCGGLKAKPRPNIENMVAIELRQPSAVLADITKERHDV